MAAIKDKYYELYIAAKVVQVALAPSVRMMMPRQKLLLPRLSLSKLWGSRVVCWLTGVWLGRIRGQLILGSLHAGELRRSRHHGGEVIDCKGDMGDRNRENSVNTCEYCTLVRS